MYLKVDGEQLYPATSVIKFNMFENIMISQ